LETIDKAEKNTSFCFNFPQSGAGFSLGTGKAAQDSRLLGPAKWLRSSTPSAYTRLLESWPHCYCWYCQVMGGSV